MSKQLVQTLSYISSSTKQMSRDDLSQILEGAIRNNELKDITGILFYSKGKFFQYLEGDSFEIEELEEVLRKDERHRGMVVLNRSKKYSRLFPDNMMAFGVVRPEDFEILRDRIDELAEQPTDADWGLIKAFCDSLLMNEAF